MSTSEGSHTQVTAAELEAEIRTGVPITILDVRDRAAFDDWHIEPSGATLINLPLEELEQDPLIPAGADGREPQRIRVLCNRGRTSVTAIQLLRDAGIEAMSVAGGMIAWSRLLTADVVPVASPATIVQFRREARGCLSYLVVSGGEALVVDPAPDVGAYLDEAARRGARITHVLDTHIHADHLSGLRALGARGALMHLSKGALARGADAADVVAVRDGDLIGVGEADVRVIGLPGHTTDNVGVVVDAVAVIAGDSLFVDSVARPDLEVGDEGAADAARVLHRTIHERLLTLGADVVLLPCHYGGGRTSGPVAATLGAVRAATPVVDLDADAFVTQVLAAMPPRPQNYVAIIAANLTPAVDDDVAGLEVGANNCAATIPGS